MLIAVTTPPLNPVDLVSKLAWNILCEFWWVIPMIAGLMALNIWITRRNNRLRRAARRADIEAGVRNALKPRRRRRKDTFLSSLSKIRGSWRESRTQRELH